MELTRLEKELLAVAPISVGASLHAFAIGKNDDVTHDDLNTIEFNLENQITDLKTKLNEVIRSLNVVIEKI